MVLAVTTRLAQTSYHYTSSPWRAA